MQPPAFPHGRRTGILARPATLRHRRVARHTASACLARRYTAQEAALRREAVLRRGALASGVLVALIVWSLIGCDQTPATRVATTPTVTSALALQPDHSRSPLPTLRPRPTRTSTPISSPSPKSMPTATLPPSPTPTPSPPPLLSPATGEPLPLSLGWQFSANGHLTDGAVVHHSGRAIFLTTSLGRTVYALDGSGQVLWQVQAAGPVYTLAVLGEDRVAVGDDAGYVTLIQPGGRAIWRHSLGSRVTALHDWQGGLLAGGWDEQLTFLSPDGQVQWQADLDGPVSGIATLPDLALAATLDGELGAFDPQGAQLWRFDAGAAVTNLGIMGEGLDSMILFAVQDGRLLALDAGGALRWQRILDADAEGSPVWHPGVLAGEATPKIIAGTGGLQPAEYPVHDQRTGRSPVSAHWAGRGGVLVLLSADGEVLWRIAVPSPVGAITSADLDGDGTPEILAGLASGEIQAYDGQGRLRASAHAGLSVWGLESASGPSVALPSATPRTGDTGGAVPRKQPALRSTASLCLRTGQAQAAWSGTGHSAGTIGDTVLVRADVTAWLLAGVEGRAGGPWLPPPAMESNPPPSLPPGTERTDTQGEAILAFMGDVAPGRSMEAQLARYGPSYPWTGLGSLLDEADLAVANLECVLTTQGKPLNKRYLIRAHPRWGQTLTEAGLDLVTIANNHALDYGQPGLNETLDTLSALDIAAVGAGRSEQEARRPALFNLNGVRVAILGYAAARWNGSADVPLTDRIAWADLATVQADVRAVRSQADFVVILLHAGTEYATEPSPDQVTVAHTAVDAGADLVVGHHPHVTQTVERYGQGLIVYSLGDALFDIPRPAAMQGDLLRVHVTREGLIQAELWPFWIDDAIRPRLLDDGHGSPRFEIVYP